MPLHKVSVKKYVWTRRDFQHSERVLGDAKHPPLSLLISLEEKCFEPEASSSFGKCGLHSLAREAIYRIDLQAHMKKMLGLAKCQKHDKKVKRR